MCGAVRRRNNRVAMNLPVEVIADGKRQRAVTQDLSPLGMFIRMTPPLPIGTVVQIVLSPNGQRLITTGQVSHSLNEVEARTLGRSPGMGVVFRDPVRPQDEQFGDAVRRLLDRHHSSQPASDLRIVVADPETRILERLSTALGNAGFSVATASNGMEAIGACLSKTPDVVLIERDMPIVDGLHVLQEMGRHAHLASVPVMMMSDDGSDLSRLRMLQLGAMDFIPKPFTVLEVILRARRWARLTKRDPDRVVLRGTLSELGLPTLLTMFEQDRKSGQLSITREHFVTWIDVLDGKIIRARSSELDADTQTVMMTVLDWKDGYFELSGAPPAQASAAEPITSVTHLLLEHARRTDEASRTS